MSSLGISITRSALRAVLLRGNRVAWRNSVLRDYDEPIADCIAQLLDTLPMRRTLPPRAVVGIGQTFCRMKPLAGLPRTTNIGLLSRAVRENSASFFLRIGARIVVSDVERVAESVYWGAAFDADVVEQTVSALRHRGFRRIDVVPTVAATSMLFRAGKRILREDDTGVEVTSNAMGQTIAIQRVDDLAIDTPAPGDDLVHGEGEFIGAYAAAATHGSAPFAWRPDPDPRRSRSINRLRTGAAGIVLLLSALFALLAPGIRAAAIVANLSVERGGESVARLEASRTQAQLARVTTQLDQIDHFASSRGEMTLLVGALAQSIPESTAVLSLRVDSSQGTFVALASHVADIVPALSSARPLADARIFGTVTRESQDAIRLERATIRFGRRRVGSTAARTGRVR